MESTIQAIKEFTASYQCISCRGQITTFDKHSNRLRCPTCDTVFLKTNGILTNHCQLMLENIKWYNVSTGVSLSLCMCTRFFYKNNFCKNTEAQICPKFKNTCKVFKLGFVLKKGPNISCHNCEFHMKISAETIQWQEIKNSFKNI